MKTFVKAGQVGVHSGDDIKILSILIKTIFIIILRTFIQKSYTLHIIIILSNNLIIFLLLTIYQPTRFELSMNTIKWPCEDMLFWNIWILIRILCLKLITLFVQLWKILADFFLCTNSISSSELLQFWEVDPFKWC